MSLIEPLEARIAPAVVITNPLPDLTAGIGVKTTTLDLAQLTAAISTSAYHTTVSFLTNFDTNPNLAGIQAGVITIELFDDLAPLTVQNFLAYVNNANAKGDYDNTLIHRAAFNPDGSPFVLQGGGFDAAAPNGHIPVFPNVHNEPDATNRPNTLGTVAMAKQAGNPNSGTSEWFVNLANNSGLNTDNGGFTVFGKVDTASLAIANAIANLRGSGDGQPSQNGVAIKVVDAKVVPATPGAATGLTYTVESVTPVGVTPADLVKAKITGSKLAVSYTGTKSGMVDVTVRVSDGTTFATDTFSVEVRPNFTNPFLSTDTLPRLMVPGDTGVVKVNVGNSGGSTGSGVVQAFLVPQTATFGTGGQITGFNDTVAVQPIAIGQASFQVASGRALDVSIPVGLTNTAFAAENNYYRISATIVPTDTPLTQEQLFTDDDSVTGVSQHNGVNKFGTFSDAIFGTRTATLKYLGESTNAQPALVTWTMKGPGFGTVGFDAQGKDVSLVVQGTNFTSSLVPTLAKNSARLSLGQLDFADAMGTATLGLVDLTGPLTASGGIKSLTLGAVTGQSLFSIGTGLVDERVKATLSFGNVENLSIESSQPFAALTVAKWLDSDANNDSIVAPSLGKLVVKGTGNFEADLTLTNAAVPLSSITVGGFLRNATIQTAGDIGAVKVGGIEQGNVFAGVTARPTALSSFAEPHKIASFTVTGGTGLSSPLFVDSQVAAQTIGTIAVKNVATTIANGAGASGFVADVINSYARVGTATKTKLTAAAVTDDTVDGTGGYSVTIL